MPFICKVASQVWETAPPDVKNRYEELAKKATQEHFKQWPDYRFRPKKRQIFKAYRPRQNPHNPKREEGSITQVPQPPASPITPPSLSPPILSPPFANDYFYFPVIGQQYYTPYYVGPGIQNEAPLSELLLHIEEGRQMINSLNGWELHNAS
ncbi:42049_t:CDS:2 [Gigaspora margarita]|uniref:42049_t:CDS:1 n=1 Tax=Gigaspora margarita TaxID=4874 RepID=A0ABN7V6P0_GIGMA|nr:42049_t:CDS:2 [Gigaspora margarita]